MRLQNLNYPIKLDIGSGKFKKDGFVGFDNLDFGQEIVWDINHGIPCPDESVSEIYTSHFLEHLKSEELPNFFSEVARVCQKGALLEIRVPHADTDEAHYLCHYTLWDESKIRGIVKDSPALTLLDISRDGIHLISKIKVK